MISKKYPVFFLILVPLLWCSLVSSNAAVKDRTKPTSLSKTLARPAEEYRVHKVGKVWCATSNFGNFGDPAVPQGLPAMEWPGGSNTHHLWEGRLWVSALVGDEMRCSHADYGNYEFKPSEGSSFVIGPGKSIEDSYVIYDDFEALPHSTAPLGVKIYQRGLTWSTPEYDDFIAYEFEIVKERGGTDYGGDVLKDVYISWVYDCDVGTGFDPTDPHIDDVVDFDGWDGPDSDTDIQDIVENVDWDGDGKFLGYDDRGIPYGWEHVGDPNNVDPHYDPSKIHPDGFYDEWTVILDDDGPPIRWQTADNPAGAAPGEIAVLNGKTLRGYVVPRNMSYMYDGDNASTPEDDTGEQGKVPGFIGGRLIYTDYYKLYGPYHTSPEDTMMRVYTHQWWNWESDPPNDVAKYQLAAGIYPPSGEVKFMKRPFEVGAPVFDYRFDLSTGPFKEFKLGETLRFVYVEAVGQGLQGLRENMDNALRAYYAGSEKGNPYNPTDFVEDLHWVLPVPPPVPELFYTPIDRGMKLAWNNVAEITIDPLLGTVDFEGYRIYRARYAPQDWEMIAAFDNVKAAVWVIDPVAKDTLGWADLPDIVHTYIDTGGVFMGRTIERPVNDLPYYYTVCAYDPYKPADPVTGRPAFESIESARVNFAIDPATGAPQEVLPKRLYEAGEVVSLRNLDVKVYPNPYRGASLLEKEYQDKIKFTNLPPACKISIFTLAGDLVQELYHTDGSHEELWDLTSRNNHAIVSGLYLYVVETKEARKIGKFVVVRGE
ncbi:MAG: T9SS type A sorting domain-containing protein [candidate division KSB1 bacterium]|nr:T9SS type A sorting domain-containing protein [candidate division KSB1 bacterium]